MPNFEQVFLRTHKHSIQACNTTQNSERVCSILLQYTPHQTATWWTQHQTNRKDKIMFKDCIAYLRNYRHLVYYIMVVKGTVSSIRISYFRPDRSIQREFFARIGWMDEVTNPNRHFTHVHTAVIIAVCFLDLVRSNRWWRNERRKPRACD